jgi:hypothetical protein
MKIIRAFTTTLAAALLLASLAPTRSTATTILRPPELGGTNHVEATKTGYVEVTIPRPVTVSFEFFRNRDVKISGGGRFTGLFLIQQGVKKPAAIYAARLRNCYEPGCKTGYGWFFMFPTGIKWEKNLEVPAGEYRLYAITDGAPLSATLKLEGLEGEASFRPTHPVHSEIGTAAADLPVNNLYSGGSTFKLPNDGMSMLAFAHDSSASVADINNDCLYKGRPSIDDAVAYAPGCTAHGASEGHGFGFTTLPLVSGGGSASVGLLTKVKAGTWSYGGSWVAPEVVEFAAFTSLWMSYD